MHVLDDMGDKSGPEKREKCFQEVDEDGSGAIDFEEFLGVTISYSHLQSVNY